MDIYNNFMNLGPVMRSIKEVNKTASNKKIS